jgi:hypothetical protein
VKRAIIWITGGVALGLLVAWVASNTHWADTTVPMPPTGEARVNPFYAVQRFAEALGARTAWHRTLTIPSPGSVIVLSSWNWGVSASRRSALEQWVESGGRLVVDSSLLGGDEDFEDWSGVIASYRDPDEEKPADASKPFDGCRGYQEGGVSISQASDTRRWMCDVVFYTHLTTKGTPLWTLRSGSRVQAMRLPVGRGSVTVINATPFTQRELFRGDHAWLFVAATQFRRGDEILFLSEDEHPSLVSLVWRHGAPVVMLGLAVVWLLLWRGAVRFGPLAAAPHPARRSLAEQIRGTGQFLLRQGGAEALHAACVRALDEAAHKRVKGYARSTPQERSSTLARLTGFDAGALTTAVYHPVMRRAHELRRTIALLESARRLIIIERRRSSHGRD